MSWAQDCIPRYHQAFGCKTGHLGDHSRNRRLEIHAALPVLQQLHSFATASANYRIEKESVTDITGRPGDRTIEINRGSTVSYLACTPRVPYLMVILVGLEAKGAFRLPGVGAKEFMLKN